MTNDTNTLTGALKEAGETLAANLTTQGVPSTWDEGLTTLIGKVLDITPGPGPTPTVDSVSLSADKSILSYADSESATLSATVLDSNDDPMEGVTVTFYNGSTSMGTADTNSSGVATKSYASTGAGDVSFTASVGTISSETYSVEDCIWSNPLTSNTGLIDWQSNTTVSYSSDGTTYKATGDTDNPVDITVPLNVECSFDVKFSDGVAGMLNLHHVWNYKDSNDMCLVDLDNASAWSNRTKKTLSLANNTWYTFKQKYEDGVTTLYIDGTSQLTKSVTKTTPSLSIRCNNHNVLMRNIKIKPL